MSNHKSRPVDKQYDSGRKSGQTFTAKATPRGGKSGRGGGFWDVLG
jgi:hypothetical protein